MKRHEKITWDKTNLKSQEVIPYSQNLIQVNKGHEKATI
jgi:hypothetical protein